MTTQWFYYTAEGQPSGPVDSRELRRLAETGIVSGDTLVRKGDSSRWVRAEQVRGVFKRTTPPPTSSHGTIPPGPPQAPPPIPRRPIDQGNRGSRSEPSTSQAAAKLTPIDAPGPNSSSESSIKPANAIRYVFAILACGFELVAYATICDITRWNRMGLIGLIPLLIFLAIWRATWVAITKTDNNGSEPTLKASSATNAPSTSYEKQPTELSKAVREQVAENVAVETTFSSSDPSHPRPLMWQAGRFSARFLKAFTKRPETFELAALFGMVGLTMLIGVIFQGVITHTSKAETLIERIHRLDKHNAWQKKAEAGQVDEREQAVIDRNASESSSSLLQKTARAMAKIEIDARRQQRAYADQASGEINAPVREMLSNLGDRRKVLGIMRQMSPKQLKEALQVSPGIGQQIGDDRVNIFARCVAAFSRGVTHGWVNPIMELVGIGGTEKEIQFIRQLDEIATQEFHPYRPGDPWFQRLPLQAIEMLPWVFVIGGVMFIAYRWKARSAQMKHATALGT